MMAETLFSLALTLLRGTQAVECLVNAKSTRRRRVHWSTYQEVYDAAIRMGSAVRSRGVNPGDRCGIYGSNCSQWIIAMEACKSVTAMPLHMFHFTTPLDVRFLLDDLQELKPTMFCGVPRVYDCIYTGIASKVSSGGVLRKTLFQYAYNYKLANLEKGLPQEKAAPLLDKLVFNKI